MHIKIRGGTLRQGESSLCLTCRHATVVQGAGIQERIVECAQLSSGSARITFAVTSCSAYSDRRLPSLREMEEIAWVLRTDPRRNQIGFVPSRQVDRRERHRLSDEEWCS
jgi:hypothetical protein